nr:hypothetical protein [Tanacetum cinerariifolium]
QESAKKQKVEDDKEITYLKQLMKFIPDKEEERTRADGSSKMYLVFSQLLKSFDIEDLVELYKLLKARYGSSRLVEDLNLLLWGDLKIMFEPYVEDESLQSGEIYMLLEKKYHLTPPTINDMLNKRLQIDYESEMAYQLLKLLMKQLKNP